MTAALLCALTFALVSWAVYVLGLLFDALSDDIGRID